MRSRVLCLGVMVVLGALLIVAPASAIRIAHWNCNDAVSSDTLNDNADAVNTQIILTNYTSAMRTPDPWNGTAVTFNGTTQYGYCQWDQNVASLWHTEACGAFEFWYYRPTGTHAAAFLGFVNYVTGTGAWEDQRLYVYNDVYSPAYINAVTADGVDYSVSWGTADSLHYDSWNQIVFTWGGGSQQLYQNGVLMRSGSSAGPDITWWAPQPYYDGWNFWLGWAYGLGPTYEGRMDEISMYNTRLDAATVAAHYNLGVSSMGGPLPDPQDSVEILHYDCNEGSGTSLTDSTGNGHTGDIYGGTSFVPDPWGGTALSFDGINGQAQCNSPEYNGLENVAYQGTMEFWYYRPTGASNTTGFMGFNTGGTNWEDELLNVFIDAWDNGYMKGSLSDGTNYIVSDSTTAPINDAWTHVVYTWDADTADLYQNGALISSEGVWSPGTDILQRNFYIGATYGLGAQFYQGYLDEIRLTAAKTTASTVLQRYEDGVNRMVNSKPTVGASNKAVVDSIMDSAASKYVWVLWGKVSNRTPSEFDIDDGSGVTIHVLGTNDEADGNYVSVKGTFDKVSKTLTSQSITRHSPETVPTAK